MTNTINYIRREPKNKFNILTFQTHQRYETELAKTGHNFYAVNMAGMRNVKDYGLENYHLMAQDSFYPYDGYDLILAQSRFGQFRMASQINQKLQIPIICLEHTVPTPDYNRQTLQEFGRMVGDVNVFICDFSRDVWSQLGITRNCNVIKHTVDTEVFKHTGERDGHYVLTVANDFKNRDYCLNYKLWEQVYNAGKHPMVALGENSHLIHNVFPEEGCDTENLVTAYSGCVAYLNTTSYSSIPMSLLEAMSCECAVITTSTCGIPEFVTDKINGLIANTPQEIDAAINTIKRNPEFARQLGRAARQTILDDCSLFRFVSEWNEIFTKTYEASL